MLKAHIKKVFAGAALLSLGLSALQAEDVFVTAFKGNSANGGDNTPCPPSCFTGSVSGTGGSSPSTAIPVPVIPASGRRMRFNSSTTPVTWSVQPIDTTFAPMAGGVTYTFTKLQHTPGIYKIYVTKGSTSQTTDLLANMTATGGNLSDTNGLPAASVPVVAFRSTAANNAWTFVGYITNTVDSPVVSFAYASGTINSTTARWYYDAVRFEYQDPCTGVATQPSIGGPLVAGQTSVDVTGITGTATNVTVYANGAQIGSTNNAAGLPLGTVTVPTTGLIKGTYISATQIATNSFGNACSNAVPTSGPIVGGGPNSNIKVTLGCWLNPSFTGPIGANVSSPGTANYFLKASGLTSGFNSAPTGGQKLVADQCWHTVTFDHSTDPKIFQGSGGVANETNAFCALEGLVFAMDESIGDSGPYAIYVDYIKNGNAVVEDFETYTVGTGATFTAPNTAGTPAVGVTYLSGAPNSSTISAANTFNGSQSCLIQWQFLDQSNQRWAHVLANSATGKHYPQLDTHQPITIRYLVLPVGSSVGTAFNGTVGSITNSGPIYTGGTNTLGVTVTGSGSYTYQWYWNADYAPGDNTSRTYTIGAGNNGFGVSSADAGLFQVYVSDGTCTELSTIYAFTNVDPVVTITNQPASQIVHVGDNATFSVGADGHVSAGYPITYQWKFNSADIAGATDATYTTNNAQVANAGSYTVGVSNSYGGVLSSAAVLDVVQPGVVIGSGTGLRGNYFTAHAATNGSAYAFSGIPTLSRIDPTVDFNFGSGSPDPSISSDLFTVRWSGQVQALDGDTYTFYTRTDDGARLWVNNQLLVNSWINQGPTEHSGTIALTANQQYPITMEYYENAVGAVAQLSWSGAAGGVAKGIIPMSQLTPAAAGAPSQTMATTINNGTNLTLSFGPGAYLLQAAGAVTGPYTNVAYGIVSPYTITNGVGSGPMLFYRLQVQ